MDKRTYKTYIPQGVALALGSALALLIIFTLLRAAFLWRFYPVGDPVSTGSLLRALYLGLKFDLRLAVIAILPVLLLSMIKPVSPTHTRTGATLYSLYMALASAFLLFSYMMDFGHYAYLEARLNATALRFLYDTATSIKMVWETYPVLWGLAGLALIALGAWKLARVLLRFATAWPAPESRRWPERVIIAVTVFLLLGAAIYGKASRYPLRWSDAYFETHPFTSNLALNPVLFFFETMKRAEKNYDEAAVRAHYPALAAYLGVEVPDTNTLNFKRAGQPRGTGSKPNVVIVLLESFAYYKTGVLGNNLDPTPNFDRIARGSLLYSRFYVPSAGTARSVFALVTGIPDVEATETSTRNPLIVNQHTIINDFKGYRKFYFLGGSLNWANIRGILSNNIEDLTIYEEGDYPGLPVEDVWGISDLHLFEAADKVLASTQEPFFAIVQTSGNHRPYTIPEDNRGFKLREENEALLLNSGFISNAEFNSFRFMDHAIGVFMAEAAKKPYYRNTVFVFLGDHGLPGFTVTMAKAEAQLGLTHYHVPLVIHAPGLINAPRAMNTIATEMDVLPTIAALCGIPHTNTTLGRDLATLKPGAPSFAFTISGQETIPRLGLVSDNFVYTVMSNGAEPRMHAYNSPEPRTNVIAEHRAMADRMHKLVMGIYETSRYLPYHNPKN